jgi:hypothetical protein
MPLQLLEEVYARGDRACHSALIEPPTSEPVQDIVRAFCSPRPSDLGR